jgi:hypothetical protein
MTTKNTKPTHCPARSEVSESQGRRTQATNTAAHREVGAMLEPLGERVAALTAEQRKYFISRVLANWEAADGA